MPGPTPDQNVNVTFDPAGNPQFSFDRPSVTMTSAGKVILHQQPPTATWKFQNAVVKNDTLNEFSAVVQGNGTLLHINDAFRDRTRTPYEYNVSVTQSGTTYTSPDPEIVNDPGSATP